MRDGFLVQFEAHVKGAVLTLERHTRLFIMLLLGVALLSRILLATQVQHPGHADRAFYYTVAENLVDRRGFQVDYIWNYLSNPDQIPWSSNDYWMPLTSIIIGISLHIFGIKSLFVALIPSIIFSFILAVPTYYYSKVLSSSKFVAYCSAGLVLFIPGLYIYSLRTDPTIYYAVFASLALLFMIRGFAKPKLLLISAIFSGLAHLTRQEGVLLILTLLLLIMFFPQHRKEKLIYSLSALVIYMLILTPLLISNYKTFGLPFPPGPSKTAFLIEYEDLYSYSKDLTLGSYLNWGIPNILRSKVEVGILNVTKLYEPLGLLWIPIIINMVKMLLTTERRQRWRAYLPPILFGCLLFGFFTLVATFPGQGAFRKSILVLIPFLLPIFFDFIRRHIQPKLVLSLVFLVIASFSTVTSIQVAKSLITKNTRIYYYPLNILKDYLQKESESEPEQDIVIMTRNPWEVHYSTGHKAIQIPNEDMDTIYQVAERYGANYLLLRLPGGDQPPSSRKALESLYYGEQLDERFEFISDIPESTIKIFRINTHQENIPLKDLEDISGEIWIPIL